MPADTANDLILITCASGKQGNDLVPLLYHHFSRLRLQVKSEASEKRLRQQYPNAEVIRADLHNPNIPAQLLDSVTAAYIVLPALSVPQASTKPHLTNPQYKTRTPHRRKRLHSRHAIPYPSTHPLLLSPTPPPPQTPQPRQQVILGNLPPRNRSTIHDPSTKPRNGEPAPTQPPLLGHTNLSDPV